MLLLSQLFRFSGRLIYGSCTCWLRIMFRDVSPSVSLGCLSRSAALKMGFQPLMPPSWHDRGPPGAAQCHDHAPAPWLTHSAAAATAAPGTGAPRGASTHARSVPLPWPGCRAAPVWPSPSRWWAPAAAAVGRSWRAAPLHSVLTRRPPAATCWRIDRLTRSMQAVLICQPHAAHTCWTASRVPNTTRCLTRTKRRRRTVCTTCAESSGGTGIPRGLGAGPVAWRRRGCPQGPKGVRRAGKSSVSPSVRTHGRPSGANRRAT